MFLAQIFLFALGSALCGASTNMSFLLGGRGTHSVFRRIVVYRHEFVTNRCIRSGARNRGWGHCFLYTNSHFGVFPTSCARARPYVEVCSVILKDLVPLHERGTFNGTLDNALLNG